jgi:hypothetical protein
MHVMPKEGETGYEAVPVRSPHIQEWNVEDVIQWTGDLKLKQDYSAVLRENDIDGEVLKTISQHLNSGEAEATLWTSFLNANVHLLGDRIRITAGFRDLLRPIETVTVENMKRSNGFNKSISFNKSSKAPGNKSVSPGAPQQKSFGAINPTFVDNPLATRQPGASAEWSSAHQLEDDSHNQFGAVRDSFSGMLIRETLWRWRRHLKLVAVVLAAALLYEFSMRLYTAGYSSFFNWLPLAVGYACVGVMTPWWVFLSLTEHNTEEKNRCAQELRSYACFASTGLAVTSFFGFNTTPYEVRLC